MKGKLIVMNFTHAYEEERFLRNPYFEWIDCTHLEGTDCYCDSEGEREVKRLIAPYPPEGIHWIDSGDYHYLTKLWTDKITSPFSLVVFDHHPDMQPSLFDNLLSCGCWVRTLLDTHPYLQKVCIIGAAEKLKKETEGYDKRLLYFSEETLSHPEAWKLFSEFYLNEPVYLSVDKDILNPKYATTNWDQGSLDLSQLLALLRVILTHERIIGVDICGDSPDLLGEIGDRLTCENINEHTDEALFRCLMHYLARDIY